MNSTVYIGLAVMDAVHFYSQGIPRVINLLCEHALINAYAEHFRPVPARMVEEAAHEFFLDEGRRFAKAEANLQAPSHATSLPELTAFDAFEGSALTVRNSTVTTAPRSEAISASMANSDASAFLKDLMLASAGPEVKSKESILCLDSIARISGSATPFNTEKKRNQATNLASAQLHLIPSGAEDESSSPAKRSPISNAQNCTRTLYTKDRLFRSSRRPVIYALLLSWKARSSQWVTGFLPTVSLAEWSRASLGALRRIRQSVFLGQALLQDWNCEFKRDWIAMINAMRCQGRKNILPPLTTAAYLFKQLVTGKVALVSHQLQRRTKH